MPFEEFRRRFLACVAAVLALAQREVSEPLPTETLYTLADGPFAHVTTPLDAVLSRLYRDGDMPFLVDIRLQGAIAGYSHVFVYAHRHASAVDLYRLPNDPPDLAPFRPSAIIVTGPVFLRPRPYTLADLEDLVPIWVRRRYGKRATSALHSTILPDGTEGWYFPRRRRLHLPDSPYHVIAPGWSHRASSVEEMQAFGFVAWERPVAAFLATGGLAACSVRLGAGVERRDDNALVGREMTVFSVVKAMRPLQLLLCDLAEEGIRRGREAGDHFDPRYGQLLELRRQAIGNAALRETFDAAWNAMILERWPMERRTHAGFLFYAAVYPFSLDQWRRPSLSQTRFVGIPE